MSFSGVVIHVWCTCFVSTFHGCALVPTSRRTMNLD